MLMVSARRTFLRVLWLLQVVLQCAGTTPDSPDAPEGMWGIPPFFVQRGPHQATQQGAAFEFRAPTTSRNALRVLRALQLKRSVLLEGSPGVGKTALIAALARAAGQPPTSPF